MEMEIGERPQKLVGGSEENVERTFHVGYAIDDVDSNVILAFLETLKPFLEFH